MKVKVLGEHGYGFAMLGLSLSYDQSVEKMPDVAERLLAKGGSHVKFLEFIVVWLDVTAPRFWWQQFDTYRIGVADPWLDVVKQSGSTMHTILKRPLTLSDFERGPPLSYLRYLNRLIEAKNFESVKNDLPEGFLQRRVVRVDYKVLSYIHAQRKNHKLKQWRVFIEAILAQVEHPRFVTLGECHGH